MTDTLTQAKLDHPHISEAEWRLMRVVWTQPGITSRQLIDTLSASTDWKVGTIKSLLSRCYNPPAFSPQIVQVRSLIDAHLNSHGV